MKTLICLVITYFFVQPDISQSSTLSKPRPVKIVTTDAKTYKGMVVDITTDYIILDLSKNKQVMVNTPYYLRPEGKYYRLDVQYIQTAFTKKRKGVAKAALVGGLAGLTSFGTASYLSNEGSDEQFKDFMGASAFGLVIGGIVGTVTGLLTHKTWHINGSSIELAAFRDYYF